MNNYLSCFLCSAKAHTQGRVDGGANTANVEASVTSFWKQIVVLQSLHYSWLCRVHFI